MRAWLTGKSWQTALGMLGFFPPVFGLLPRSCEPDGPQGPGAGGEQSGAGEAGQVGGGSAGTGNESGAGGAAESGASGAGGDSGTATDRVVEPLLGCASGVSGKQTPGVFELIEPNFDFGQPEDQPWLKDWSGDGQTAVGVHTNDPFEDAYGAFFVSWRAGRGWQVDAKARIELSQFHETPDVRVNCDGRVRAQLLGDGSIWSTNAALGEPNPEHLPRWHNDFLLSEDGNVISYFASISESVRPWASWHDSNGNVLGLTLERVQSLSWDGMTAFGTSSCYTQTCTYPKTFRWRPLESGEDVTTTAPTPYVAADGETIVYNYNETHLGIWRAEATEIVDCVDPCQAVAWSSRARVLLVNRDNDFAIWTKPHGFRRLSELIDIPDGTAIVPSGLSLDGWTVTGQAASEAAPFGNFRATLKADAFL